MSVGSYGQWGPLSPVECKLLWSVGSSLSPVECKLLWSCSPRAKHGAKKLPEYEDKEEDLLRRLRMTGKVLTDQDVIKDFPLRRVSRLHGCSSEKDVLEVCDDYDQERNEYFFDRHSEAFGFIMMYVKYGKLRFVPQMCELSFYNEMIYWGLECSQLEYCCQRRLDDRMSDTYTYMSDETKPDETAVKEDLQAPGEKKWLERMRRTFEEPTSSLAAQILAVISIIFVIVSMVVLCASTLPDWKTAENRSVEEHSVVDGYRRMLHAPLSLTWGRMDMRRYALSSIVRRMRHLGAPDRVRPTLHVAFFLRQISGQRMRQKTLLCVCSLTCVLGCVDDAVPKDTNVNVA
ncbi:unnamed protein product [Ranitomeya imitator]|uniref:Potassium channel tetramerisation-type BTB domain-containing protein n=1 Tax=Ranitomeya imitator TaxID=111125 RepID=A0ABN9KV11_9NEOB|nr:unnamed protein product [Ranitomeya imitator]